LYDCLAATFRQDYPKDKLHIRFCVSSPNDPSIAVARQLLQDFPGFDAQLLIENEDELLTAGNLKLGPNPKIRNMSRAYREAPGNIVWIIDCNVWVARGVCSRMVAKLEGTGNGATRPHKCVHLCPIVVDIERATAGEDSQAHDSSREVRPTHVSGKASYERTAYSIGGGRLEEQFMSSAHAKFYHAINTVLVAPCMVGKSTMFRRSHLDHLTSGAGIDAFSHNICEDQLIGDMLWKQKVPEERSGQAWGKHALCFGDLAIQPMANMSLGEYWSRRVRWLRVRKFTVTLATFVEPGTESFLWSVYGAFAMTTLPWFREELGIPPTWTAFALIWLLGVAVWCTLDRQLYLFLHSAVSIDVDADTPFFARGLRDGVKRPFRQWFLAWLGREALALPVWTWAFWFGTSVAWRGKRFRVGLDMKVHEIIDDNVVKGE
jgi:ceramide glucosyltransferase